MDERRHGTTRVVIEIDERGSAGVFA